MWAFPSFSRGTESGKFLTRQKLFENALDACKGTPRPRVSVSVEEVKSFLLNQPPPQGTEAVAEHPPENAGAHIIRAPDTRLFSVEVKDNGPGFDRGSLDHLVGSVFSSSRADAPGSAGCFGVGLKGALVYGQLTSGVPAVIETQGMRYRVQLDLRGDIARPTELASCGLETLVRVHALGTHGAVRRIASYVRVVSKAFRPFPAVSLVPMPRREPEMWNWAQERRLRGCAVMARLSVGYTPVDATEEVEFCARCLVNGRPLENLEPIQALLPQSGLFAPLVEETRHTRDLAFEAILRAPHPLPLAMRVELFVEFREESLRYEDLRKSSFQLAASRLRLVRGLVARMWGEFLSGFEFLESAEEKTYREAEELLVPQIARCIAGIAARGGGGAPELREVQETEGAQQLIRERLLRALRLHDPPAGADPALGAAAE
eukprot:gnl/Chilomastix_cuspidata/5111.p1 GENE.gnl/Chilomastix_cuspidata/5111~~gnl/Chilomastix_cuspidata/5111.p1  ORF type:complete len:433 (-),score=169.61 gnl/Chilomastix_cuspidata/5111:212-1510(-)